MSRSLLDTVRIASPCPVSWESMPGDDRVRFCSHCDLHVFNLSEMNQKEAEDLIRRKEGRLCARYYLRGDGKVMTADCPEMAATRRERQVEAFVGLVFAMLIGMFLWLRVYATAEPEQSWLREHEPFRTVLNWLIPKPTITFVTIAHGALECSSPEPVETTESTEPSSGQGK